MWAELLGAHKGGVVIRTIGRRRAAAVCAVALTLAVTASVNAATAAPGTLTWAKLRPATTPSPRAGAAMAYDPGLGRVVMFGGYDQTGYLNTTWAWNGTTWKHVQIPPSQSPPPRAAAGMGYDATDKILIMYGGFDGQRWLRDTWAFDSFDRTWERLRPAHQPPPETGPMLF